jgi:hypothetical protein
VAGASSSAHAITGNMSTLPAPSSPANTPTRPTCLAYPIANPSVGATGC